jgi:hypothetical protein
VVSDDTPRRVYALVRGLPPDAATWRSDRWTPEMETAVFAIERNDQWLRALLDALLNKKQIPIPGPLEINRPGEEPAPERKRVRPAAGLATLRQLAAPRQ